jgi:2-polyprenyl-3-methyl-5-hydroxy-6-metoxy-1,4-benzoquinol methylase/dTDP-4-dehydrorhamnose 3,5-epimerase-like enzyme
MLQYRFGILRRFLHGDSLLEVGSSEGEMTALLASAGKAMTLVDASADCCATLRRKFPQASVVQASYDELQVRDRYDIVVLNGLLEHVADPAGLLTRVRGWLRPNGQIFAAAPNALSMHRQMATIMGELPDPRAPSGAEGHDGPRRIFDPEALHGAFTQAGLRVDAEGGYSLRPISEELACFRGVRPPALTPAMTNAFMQLGERYPSVAEEIYVVASAPPIMLATNAPMDNCRIIQLPKISDPRGNLTFIENSRHIPFDIRRIYYLYDVPGGSDRGGHAHRKLQQFVVATSGSFDVVLDDGNRQQRYHLNRSYQGLYIGPMMWRNLDNFSSGAVCTVLASSPYDESDYYRDYDEFVAAVQSGKP